MTSSAVPSCDVLVLGGGLAGLTLALQLRQRFADLSVLVLERKAHPVPHAAHKVGESSVEIGAHYFSQVLGLQDHLNTQQLKKFGFRFFFSEGRRDIDQVTELGSSRYLSVPSYQIDRGVFENHLGQEAHRRGIRFVDQAVVRQVRLASTGTEDVPHQVTWEHAGITQVTRARWVVDASGRAGLLKRQLDLAQPNAHEAHAVWFRMQGRIDVDTWSKDAAWHARCDPPHRWQSTNHLVGAGYWVWLIPLSSGSHSVGIVADPRLHPLDTMNTFDKAMAWLERFQPRLFDELDPRRGGLQDFAFLRRFSYGCKQLFSAQRWALTGEAGLFLDPFYSPGSDFIAMGNTYITDLVGRDLAGQRWGAQAQLYDQLMRSFYDNTLALYVDQYPLFADAEVMPIKVIWDYAYYWGVLSQFFFQNRLTDIAAMARLRAELAHCESLNRAAQDILRRWSQVSARHNPAVMLDQAALPWFAELNASLQDAALDTEAFVARLRQSTLQLRALLRQIVERAQRDHPALDASLAEAALAANPLPGQPNPWDTVSLLALGRVQAAQRPLEVLA
jgi:flavin-dependent dehydrogenase